MITRPQKHRFTNNIIADVDKDTYIEVENTADDDIVRIGLGGTTPIVDAATFDQTNGFYFNTNQDDLDFKVSGSGNEYGIWFDAANNNTYINGSTPVVFNATNIDVKLLTRSDDTNTSVGLGSISHSDTAGRAGIFFGGRSRGTEGSETAVQLDDVLFAFTGLGHGGTDYEKAASIDVITDGTVTTTTVPGRIVFSTTESGGLDVTEKMRISKDGITINEGSNAYSYRMETTGDEYAFHNDGTNDVISMGTPDTSWTINGITVRPKLAIHRAGGDNNINFITLSNSDTASAGAFMVGMRARGLGTSINTYNAVQNGDRMLVFRNDAHDGTEFLTSGDFSFTVGSTVSTGIIPTSFAIALTDTLGNKRNAVEVRYDGRVTFQDVATGADQIQFFANGGLRGNLQGNSAGTSDFIWKSTAYGNMFRIDNSANEVNIGNAVQGVIFSADGDTQVITINRANTGADLRVESSSAGVNLWETNTTDDFVKSNGGSRVKVTRVTSTPYTVGIDEYVLYIDTDSAAITVNLPAGVNGQTYKIINVGSSGNNVTLTPNGAESLLGTAGSATITDGNDLFITYQSVEGWW